jgi:hypothetical protein
VHEAKTDTDLARLFASCRSGHVAVLLGSTEKMGVGTFTDCDRPNMAFDLRQCIAYMSATERIPT